ncbi:four helix bundle protein [Candidatus Saccharibacteria bacterium]|nr:four helix bundle protein [Candidatus Saccharibacteria bacterium]
MNELPVIIRTHELYDQISKITEKMAGLKRQTIGRRCENKTLELLEILIMAKNAPRAMKAAYLIKATAVNEIINFHLRTLMNQKLANDTTLHQLLAKNDEIGRMIGGWRKSVQ